MNLFHFLLLLAVILIIPRVLYWSCKKIRILGFLGPSLLCFISGIAFSFILPDSSYASPISDWSVCLAIPFMLFSLDFRAMRKLAKSAILSFILICFHYMILIRPEIPIMIYVNLRIKTPSNLSTILFAINPPIKMLIIPIII